MKRFEYRLQPFEGENAIETLNKLGAEGWHVVSPFSTAQQVAMGPGQMKTQIDIVGVMLEREVVDAEVPEAITRAFEPGTIRMSPAQWTTETFPLQLPSSGNLLEGWSG